MQLLKDVGILMGKGLQYLFDSESLLHFNLFEIGKSRTAFPKRLFNGSNENAVLQSLETAFSPEHKEELVVEPGYSSLWAFSKYMVWPILSGRFSTGK